MLTTIAQAAQASAFEHGWQFGLIVILITGFGIVGRWLLLENSKHREREVAILLGELNESRVQNKDSSDEVQQSRQDRAEQIKQQERLTQQQQQIAEKYDSTANRALEFARLAKETAATFERIQERCGMTVEQFERHAKDVIAAEQRRTETRQRQQAGEA